MFLYLCADRHIQTVWILCHWLAMSHCCYNPFVYCWMNDKFRAGFRRLFNWFPCVAAPADEHALQTDDTTQARMSTTLTTGEQGQVGQRARRAGCSVSYIAAESTVNFREKRTHDSV